MPSQCLMNVSFKKFLRTLVLFYRGANAMDDGMVSFFLLIKTSQQK